MRSSLKFLMMALILSACGETASTVPSPGVGADDASGHDLGATDSVESGDGPGGDAAPTADVAAKLDINTTADIVVESDIAADSESAAESDIAAEPDAAAEVDAAVEIDAGPEADIAAESDGAADAVAGPDVAPCVATAPATEICDGLDNDCDGNTDTGDLCQDGNPCTVGSCGPLAGQVACSQKPGPGGEPCDDGNPCSSASACAQGTCAGDPTCSDGVPCTFDVCDTVKGCVFTASDGKCADGNSCTTDTCKIVKGCSHSPAPGGCDDGDACSSGSACADGACVGNQPVDCDDKNPCTNDTCDKAKGCLHLATSTPCDDGNACTSGEQCAATQCQGGKAKCDDVDVCTADSCDSAGTCGHTVLSGCQKCTAASDCSDANACTTDSCSAGKCAWSPISGCVGNTDYSVTTFTSNKATLTGGAVATFSVGVTNKGKPWAGGAIAKLKWEVWFSTDDQLDAADALAVTKTWNSYNIGAPNQTFATESQPWTYARPVTWYHKFQCVKLVYPADGNPADNVKCLPVIVEDGEVSLKSIVAAGSKVKTTYAPFTNPTSTILVETENPGTKAIQPTTTVYLSHDDKWDVADKLLSLTIKPTVAKGKSTTTLTFGTLQFQSATTGKVWVCVRADIDIAQYEQSPGDNTVCGQVDFENPAEFVHGDPTYTNGYLTFDQTTGTGTATWGLAAACKKLGVYNIGLGKITGGFKARCFLSTTGKPDDAGWMHEWTHGGDLGSGELGCSGGYTCGAKADLTSSLGPKVQTPAVGATKLCVEVNHDKAVLEANYTNNTLCVPATVVGANMQISTKLTAENGGVAVGLKVGVAWSGMFAVTNVGNADLAGVEGKFLSRIFLSVDDKLSADDVKLWQGVQTGFNNFTKQVGQFPNNYSLPTSSTKPTVTVPAGTPAGSYFLLYQINADDLFAEPLGDNLFAKPASVSL